MRGVVGFDEDVGEGGGGNFILGDCFTDIEVVAFFGLAVAGDLLAGFPVDFPDDSGPLPFICSWLVGGVAT